MNELVRLAARSRATTFALLLLGLASGGSGAALVWLIGERLSRAGATAGEFGALLLLALASRIAFVRLLNRLHQSAVLELRRELARRILSSPLRTLEEVGSARLQATLTVDVLTLSDGFRVLPALFINATSAFGCLAYLAWLSLPAFAATIAFGTLGLLSYWIPTQGAVRVARSAREREDVLFQQLRSLTDGIKELMLHRPRREEFVARCLDPTAREVCRLATHSDNIYGSTASWGLFLFYVLIGIVLFALPHVLALDARVLTGYAFAILYLQQPLAVILEALPMVNRSEVALGRIRSLGLGLGQAPAPLARVNAPQRRFQSLELRAVTHVYHREQQDDRFILGPIDLSLARGELVFLVGGNGSGKTTLGKLVAGLYAPESGELRLNEDTVSSAELESYRQCFSAVFSDFHLFERLLGVPDDAAARVQDYLVQLHLDRKVSVRDGQFSSTALSLGQRKRLALLAAYLEDRPVYVFDEWAADQDPSFKRVFYEQLLPELKRRGKAVLVITHDDQYFHVADRVLHLESGRLLGTEGARARYDSVLVTSILRINGSC